MKQVGPHIGKTGVEDSGFYNLETVYWNHGPEALYQEAVRRNEGKIAKCGPLAVLTGTHTGRSASDKFIVRDETTRDCVWWDNAAAMSPESFDLLHEDFMAYAEGKDLFVQDLFGGADSAHRLSTRVFCQYAWHALFIRYLLRRPDGRDLENFTPEFTVINLPGFRADPQRHGVNSQTVIACNYTRRIVLIGGTSYAGETKKSVFGMLNFDLPAKGVMPMHCSANVGADNDTAIFFGLSGTGKTTLSTDPSRTLIGDDEHGWSQKGIFNFEGGCYAKTIRLSAQAEPEIHATTQRFGAVLENVMMDEDSRELDFDDTSLTENGRVAYPMDFIANGSRSGLAGHPQNIIMLTADAFGVLPPIARLTPAQAMYHFLSGYTAKVAGTEKGLTEPAATFSTCFGAPFMSRHPSVYGNLLRDLIARHKVSCWLVNTGWTGGSYGVGSRMPIKATRALLAAALAGGLSNAKMRIDVNFGFEVPVTLDGIDAEILNPRTTWDDPEAYDAQAQALVQMFIDNFEKFEDYVDADVLAAAPMLRRAAE